MRSGPLFVVGMWRSGTSLLYALLNQHPQIGLMYESDMLTLSPLFLIPRKSLWWLNKVDSWNGALSRHKIDPTAIPENINGLPNAFRAVAQQYASKKGATVWGCKSPTYYDCMVQFAKWYPDAKFIVIWRDPADVCRSIVRAAEKAVWFARPGTDLRAILGYRRMKQEADELVRRGAQIYQLQYDDLVRDPATTLSAICDFVGIPFDSRMTSTRGCRPLCRVWWRTSLRGKELDHRRQTRAPGSAFPGAQEQGRTICRVLARAVRREVAGERYRDRGNLRCLIGRTNPRSSSAQSSTYRRSYSPFLICGCPSSTLAEVPSDEIQVPTSCSEAEQE